MLLFSLSILMFTIINSCALYVYNSKYYSKSLCYKRQEPFLCFHSDAVDFFGKNDLPKGFSMVLNIFLIVTFS